MLNSLLGHHDDFLRGALKYVHYLDICTFLTYNVEISLIFTKSMCRRHKYRGHSPMYAVKMTYALLKSDKTGKKLIIMDGSQMTRSARHDAEYKYRL